MVLRRSEFGQLEKQADLRGFVALNEVPDNLAPEPTFVGILHNGDFRR